MRKILLVALLFCFAGCLPKDDSSEEQGWLLAALWFAAQPDYTWNQFSPPGGFVSNIIHHPSTPSLLFASGDDASGFYRSEDGGANWTLLTGVPLNHSTYSFVFDPTNAQIMYAPNHFGRGLLKSTDGGTTWQLLTQGLPTDNDSKVAYDLAVDAGNTNIIYMALSGGLYRSQDAGASFTALSSAAFTANTDTDFRAVVVRANSDVFAATEKGRVYKSTDQGNTWSEITTGGFVGISDLEVTNNALYIAFKEGTITKTTTFNGSFTFVNNATAGGDIESGLWTRIKAVSGADANSDILYIGTVYKSGSSKWGFHVSTDGGTTLTRRVTGLADASAFDLSVNPTNSNEIFFASVNSGVYKTSDQGLNWSSASGAIRAHASLALVEDPVNPAHVLFSSTAGLDGTSKLWETADGGVNWSEVAFFNDKSVRSLLMPAANSSTIIAGTSLKGIYRTQTGSAGTWTQVLSTPIIFQRMANDALNPNLLYASAFEPTGHADLGVYVSEDGGGAWTRRYSGAVVNVVPRPGFSREAVVLSADAFATADGLQTSPTSLGLATFAPSQFFYSAAFVPGAPTTLLVGSSTGRLFRTTNYNSAGSEIAWSEISVPLNDVLITDIVALDALTWYLACWTGDKFARASSTPGILRTRNGGLTWEFMTQGLYPADLTYRLKASVHAPGRYYVGMWGAGFYALQD